MRKMQLAGYLKGTRVFIIQFDASARLAFARTVIFRLRIEDPSNRNTQGLRPCGRLSKLQAGLDTPKEVPRVWGLTWDLVWADLGPWIHFSSTRVHPTLPRFVEYPFSSQSAPMHEDQHSVIAILPMPRAKISGEFKLASSSWGACAIMLDHLISPSCPDQGFAGDSPGWIKRRR